MKIMIFYCEIYFGFVGYWLLLLLLLVMLLLAKAHVG